MLKRIYIDGFRHFKNFTFELDPQMTLLCGLNGTGKTTIVEIINRLQLFLVSALPVTSLYPYTDIPIWALNDHGAFSSTFGFDIEIDTTVYAYEIESKYNFRDALCRVEKEILQVDKNIVFESTSGNVKILTDDDRQFTYPVDWTFTGLVLAGRNSRKIRDFLQIMKENIFSVSINPFSISSSHSDYEPILNLDGSNFSAWYDYLLDKKIAVIADTFTEIASFVPGFKQFVLDKEGKNKSLFADIFINKMQSYRLPFENFSHGQKILCLLHFLIRICPESATIIIDELENFLSPVELQPLYNAVQDAFEEKNTQCIFVSHHHKTINWYHDSAMILSFSGSPSFVRIKKFLMNEYSSIEEILVTNMDVS